MQKCGHYLKTLCVDIAVTSAWMLEHMHDQTITHTPADTSENVDCSKLVELAGALKNLVTAP
ncbi:MAG: hypothetical protein EA363_08875 [Balneolaceae bacterium]|nr:MAG: hypothetical protein EA363_08875 [Balneolaceae bacterium]